MDDTALSYDHELFSSKKAKYAVLGSSTLLCIFVTTTIALAFVNGLRQYHAGLFVLGISLLGVGLAFGFLGRWSFRQGSDEDYVRNVTVAFAASLLLFSIAMYITMYSISPSARCELMEGSHFGINEELPAPYENSCFPRPECFGSPTQCLIFQGSAGYRCCDIVEPGVCDCNPRPPEPVMTPPPVPMGTPTP